MNYTVKIIDITGINRINNDGAIISAGPGGWWWNGTSNCGS
jgi:hypothetical protein